MADLLQSPLPNHPAIRDDSSYENQLGELRTGRRLQKLTRSIESFLENQMTRLQDAIDKCEAAEEQNAVLQRMMADFEKQKREWEKKRLAEEQRLFDSGEQLMQGWQQLEIEKRNMGIE